MQETAVLEKDGANSTIEVSYTKPDYPFQNYTYTENSNAWVSFKMHIIDLNSNKYELKIPILVQVESYKDGYLISDDDVNRHGMGDTLEDARCDYEDALLGYFNSLNEHYPNISPRLKRDYDFLNQIIGMK